MNFVLLVSTYSGSYFSIEFFLVSIPLFPLNISRNFDIFFISALDATLLPIANDPSPTAFALYPYDIDPLLVDSFSLPKASECALNTLACSPTANPWSAFSSTNAYLPIAVDPFANAKDNTPIAIAWSAAATDLDPIAIADLPPAYVGEYCVESMYEPLNSS